MVSKIDKLQETMDKLLIETDGRNHLIRKIERLEREKQIWLNTEWIGGFYIALKFPMPEWQKRNPYLRIPVFMRSSEYTNDKDGYEMNGLVEFCGKLLPEFYIYKWEPYSVQWDLTCSVIPIKTKEPRP